ncbi:MAG TPA: DUF2157 domain-containing protein [Nocardioidaceae bacterium]|nr:DUF2157 domain-containing protein [Nocardioidaceae bacterium]
MATTQAPKVSAHPASPGQLAWLDRELASWVAGDLVTPETSAAIRGRYVAVRTFSLNRVLLNLGAVFVGVGLIWLVATNLDQFTPGVRFVVVTAIWLAVTAGAEFVADRRDGSPVVGALRGLASAGFGAVVFQAAQSLQVPAYEPSLIGYWAAGALLYSYACRGVAPLLVGTATAATWFVWQIVETTESASSAILALLVAGALGSALAFLHTRPSFASVWRVAGSTLMLGGLFVAALPFVEADELTWTLTLTATVVIATIAAGTAIVRSRGWERVEVLVPFLAVPVGVLLVIWNPPLPDHGVASGQAWVSALVSVGVYVVAAGAVAVLGALRDSPMLSALATLALVIFTVTQSFAVFAPIVSGAALFLLLGVILIVTGILFDRVRREVTETIEEARS